MHDTVTRNTTKISGQEHWAQKDRARLFLWEKCVGDRGRPGGSGRRRSVRTQLLDGLTADFRSACARAAGFVRDGMVRKPRLRLLVPTGTYVDMCTHLPMLDPEKIAAATLIVRGQWDGIAGYTDTEWRARLACRCASKDAATSRRKGRPRSLTEMRFPSMRSRPSAANGFRASNSG